MITRRQMMVTFNKCLTKHCLDVEKVNALPAEERYLAAMCMIRNRLPVVKEFAAEILNGTYPPFDRAWLHSMGYLYETKGKYYTFLHTSEQRVS